MRNKKRLITYLRESVYIGFFICLCNTSTDLPFHNAKIFKKFKLNKKKLQNNDYLIQGSNFYRKNKLYN